MTFQMFEHSAAWPGRSATAFGRQFGQCPAHPPQRADAFLNVRQFCFGPRANIRTRLLAVHPQVQEFLDFTEGETKLLRPSDKADTPSRLGWIETVIGSRTRRFRQKTRPLVKTKRGDAHLGFPRKLAHCQSALVDGWFCHFTIKPKPCT